MTMGLGGVVTSVERCLGIGIPVFPMRNIVCLLYIRGRGGSSMELRFLKGHWGFGKFKLQAKPSELSGWVDVPMVSESEVKEWPVECDKHGYKGRECPSCKLEESKVKWPCECLEYRKDGLRGTLYVKSEYLSDGRVSASWPVYVANFCPICGTPRPKEQSLRGKLAEKLQKSSPQGDFYDMADIAIDFLAREGGWKE